MVAIVVQPEDHGRILGQFYQKVLEFTQTILPKHGNLGGQFRRIIHFGVTSGEQLVPKECHLFFKVPMGVYHAIDPLGLVDGGCPRHFVARHEPEENALVDRSLIFGVQ